MWLSAHTSEPAVKSATPAPQMRVGPRDCPSDDTPNSDIVIASKYALATHTICAGDTCSSRPMVGNAMFAIEESIEVRIVPRISAA